MLSGSDSNYPYRPLTQEEAAAKQDAILVRGKSNWREDEPAPQREEDAIREGVPVKKVERANNFFQESMSAASFRNQSAEQVVRLTWRLPGGGEKTTIAKRKPLGINFPLNTTPLKILRDPRPGTHAAEIGIKEGWELIQINDTFLPSDTSFYEVDTMLHCVLGMLPS